MHTEFTVSKSGARLVSEQSQTYIYDIRPLVRKS